MTTSNGYSRTQITLHWLTAIAVLIAWFTHDAMEEIATAAWKAGTAPFPTVHSVAGMLALVLIIIRLVIRHRHGAPEPLGEGLQREAAIWGHRALYALVILAPLLGFLTWIVGIKALSEPHEITAKLLMILALGHAVMAIWHQFGKKDGTLMRMIKSGS